MNVKKKVPIVVDDYHVHWFIHFEAGESLNDISKTGGDLLELLETVANGFLRFEDLRVLYRCPSDYQKFIHQQNDPVADETNPEEQFIEDTDGNALSATKRELSTSCPTGVPIIQSLQSTAVSTNLCVDSDERWISQSSPELELWRYGSYQAKPVTADPISMVLRFIPEGRGSRDNNEYKLILTTKTNIWWLDDPYRVENYNRLKSLLSKLASDERVVNIDAAADRIERAELMRLYQE
ncbi:hypothetical protein ACH9L7_09980 [Haloferax sp. S1W]|uniref:hypothetical protein n=1 Tax=Haloferax sp. S1W TaxID=3377110 RepID=UPI0037CC3515